MALPFEAPARQPSLTPPRGRRVNLNLPASKIAPVSGATSVEQSRGKCGSVKRSIPTSPQPRRVEPSGPIRGTRQTSQWSESPISRPVPQMPPFRAIARGPVRPKTYGLCISRASVLEIQNPSGVRRLRRVAQSWPADVQLYRRTDCSESYRSHRLPRDVDGAACSFQLSQPLCPEEPN